MFPVICGSVLDENITTHEQQRKEDRKPQPALKVIHKNFNTKKNKNTNGRKTGNKKWLKKRKS